MTRRSRRVLHVLAQIARILVLALAALGPGMPPPPPPPRRAPEELVVSERTTAKVSVPRS